MLVFGKGHVGDIHLTLDGNKIEVVRSAMHMGVLLGKDADHISERILKGKRATSAMQSLTRSWKILNPVIGSKIYWAVSIPTMMYGAEIWDMAESELYRFEKAHRQMAKSVQGLPVNVADGACLATMGWVSLESWVDRRRLVFLWNILNLSMNNIYKQCSVARLCEIRYWTKEVQPSGPVAKLYETCVKYGLDEEVNAMLDSGIMVGKAQWTRELSKRIMVRETSIWWCSIHLYPSLGIYRTVIPGVALSWWWALADKTPGVREYCRSVVRVITGACVWWNGNVDSDADVCILCKSMKDSVEHFLYACSALDRERLALINEASMHVKSNEYISLSMEQKWLLLLTNGGHTEFVEWCTLGCVVAKNVHIMLSHKRDLINEL